MTFEEYLLEAQPRLLRFATVLTGDPHLAEDVVQSALLKTYSRWSEVAAMARPHAYVRRVVVNDYLSWRRKWQRQHSAADIEPLLPELTDHADATDDQLDLLRRLATLPRQQRAAVVLRYYEDLTTAEIATALQCRESTVRSTLARALARLRVDLDAPVAVETEKR